MDAKHFLRNSYCSKFQTSRSPTGNRVLIWDELERIKSGFYSELIRPCRELYITNKVEYKNNKANLPAVAFSGVFNGSHKKEFLSVYNQIVVIDIDQVTGDLERIREKLLVDPYVFAFWRSPSGDGLKLLVKAESDAAMHKFSYDRIVDHLSASHDIDIDISGSDVSRLCFVSDDPDIVVKDRINPFPLAVDEWYLSNISKEVRHDNLPEIYSRSEKALLYRTEGRNRAVDRDMARKMIAYLKKNKLSITEKYPAWVKVAFAIANSFTYDLGQKIFLEFCRLDGSAHDECKSEQLLQYCYRKRRPDEVNFATIIYFASLKGFVVAPFNRNGHSQTVVPPISPVQYKS